MMDFGMGKMKLVDGRVVRLVMVVLNVKFVLLLWILECEGVYDVDVFVLVEDFDEGEDESVLEVEENVGVFEDDV